MANKLRIGSRGSKLALWQSEYIKKLLLDSNPGMSVEIEITKTRGDHIQDVALSKVGGKGLFTKELEDSLLAGETDFAVHSLKDLPTELPAGLDSLIITKRNHPYDALISREGKALDSLRAGGKIGTSSLRRRVQLMAAYPELEIVDMRGNVDTRLAKLERGDCKAIILAQAGLERLGLGSHITQVLTPEFMIPAPGQGALAVEFRIDDKRTREVLELFEDKRTALEVPQERQFLHTLGGGCQLPVGATAIWDEATGEIWLRGLIGDLDEGRVIKDEIRGGVNDNLGRMLAEKMLAAGGAGMLEKALKEQEKNQ